METLFWYRVALTAVTVYAYLYALFTYRDEKGEVQLILGYTPFHSSTYQIYHTLMIGVSAVYLIDLYVVPPNDKQLTSLFYVGVLSIFFAMSLSKTDGSHLAEQKIRFDSGISSLKWLFEEMVPTEDRSCFLSTMTHEGTDHAHNELAPFWITLPEDLGISEPVVDPEYTRDVECAKDPYSPTCTHFREYAYFNYSYNLQSMAYRTASDAAKYLPLWGLSVGIHPDNSEQLNSCVDLLEIVLRNVWMPRCGRSCYRRKFCKADCFHLQRNCPRALFESVMETYDFFTRVWTLNIDEPFKESLRPIMEVLADESCSSLNDTCVAPTNAWIAQGGTLDSCYKSGTEPSYLMLLDDRYYQYLGSVSIDQFVSRENEILWPNSSALVANPNANVSWWQSDTPVKSAFTASFTHIASIFAYYFATVEDNFKFLVRKLSTVTDAKRLFLNLTWSYQYHLRIMCNTLMIFIPYYCLRSHAGGASRDHTLKVAERYYRVNTPHIHLLVLCQVFFAFKIQYSCSRLTERFERQGIKHTEDSETHSQSGKEFPNYFLLNFMWAIAITFYVQVNETSSKGETAPFPS